MRQIGKLPNKSAATLLSDYLLTQKITTRIEALAGNTDETEQWILWGLNEDQTDRARQIFNEFQANPNDPVYHSSISNAQAMRRQEKAEQARRERQTYNADRLWSQPRWRDIPVTSTLIAISVIVGLYTNFGAGAPGFINQLYYRPIPSSHFRFPPGEGSEALQQQMDVLAEMLSTKQKNPSAHAAILQGQVWRLITPIFIHLSPLHLLFNMLVLHNLGGVLELRKGRWKLLAMVLFIAAFSNFAQAQFYSPRFGGMSGVVYGLFVYIWMRGLIDSAFGLGIHQQQFILMMLWMVMGFTMPNMNMANGAHLGGAIAGAILAFGGTWLRNFRTARSH